MIAGGWGVSLALSPAGTINSGWTLMDWQAYADRYHGPGCAVTAVAGLPKLAPVNLDEALRTACDGVGHHHGAVPGAAEP